MESSRRGFLQKIGKLAGVVGIASVSPPGMPKGTEGAIVVPQTPDVEQAVRNYVEEEYLVIPRRAIKKWQFSIERDEIDVTSYSSGYRQFAPVSETLNLTLDIQLQHHNGIALVLRGKGSGPIGGPCLTGFVPNENGLLVYSEE